MTQPDLPRTPENELLDSMEVTLLSPLWSMRPVFHRSVYWFPGSELPPNRSSFADRLAIQMPELPWKTTAVETRCGRILRATFWLEEEHPTPKGPLKTIEWSIDRSVVELRFDHARQFARPCRRCWPDTPTTR